MTMTTWAALVLLAMVGAYAALLEDDHGRGRFPGMIRPEDVPALQRWVRVWYEWSAATFLQAYSLAMQGSRLLPLLDVVSPNESELARLTGMPTADDGQVLAAARCLQAKGVGTVLVKLGSRGCLLVPRHGEPLIQRALTVTVVDTTGAGDCFTGAYTVGLVEGMAERDRLRFACAAAALCVQRLGALPSMPLLCGQ